MDYSAHDAPSTLGLSGCPTRNRAIFSFVEYALSQIEDVNHPFLTKLTFRYYVLLPQLKSQHFQCATEPVFRLKLSYLKRPTE